MMDNYSYLQKLSQLGLQVPLGLKNLSGIGLIDTVLLHTRPSAMVIRSHAVVPTT